ncbi:uncharacterized protein LOC131875725 [Cryptomeria japonica]|uniref:uncharacterized protein LOC131875725 n=1 Tax=Cryptomeria japonica TaxID=3369 RepID=UPI0027DA05C6|nr:uncharacterized protein LOC131875725 [Cryptomeria japonica]
MSFEEAIKEEHCIKAMDEEINFIERNQTWELVDLPEGKDCIGVEWVYKTKFNAEGEIDKRKAILVAKGYAQQHGIDYIEIFAPVASLDTIRMVLAIAAQNNWIFFQMDVKSVFLNGFLEEVYVKQALGYEVHGHEDKFYRLKKGTSSMSAGLCDLEFGSAVVDKGKVAGRVVLATALFPASPPAPVPCKSVLRAESRCHRYLFADDRSLLLVSSTSTPPPASTTHYHRRHADSSQHWPPSSVSPASAHFHRCSLQNATKPPLSARLRQPSPVDDTRPEDPCPPRARRPLARGYKPSTPDPYGHHAAHIVVFAYSAT